MKPVLCRSLRARLARPASVRRNLAKTLLQIVVMWSIFLYAAPVAISRLEESSPIGKRRFTSPLLRTFSICLFLAGGTLGLVSAWFMVTRGQGTPLPADATRSLVVAGPYRHVRNPMAIGSFAQGIAVGLFLGSPSATAYALAGAAGWNYLVRPWEEFDLEQRFGPPYAAYRDSVRCWIPQLQPYEPPEAA